MNDTKCPTCGNADAYGYCDEAQVMTCVSCGYSEASDLRRQLADAQAILIRLADDALAISIAHRCCDPHHDGRWCPTCDARNAGIEAYREAVRAKGDSDAS